MLLRWAKKDPANQQQIEDWLDETVAAIADGKGSEIISSSMNGVSFMKNQASMTYMDWATLLDCVLLHLENGTMPTSKTYGVIR